MRAPNPSTVVLIFAALTACSDSGRSLTGPERDSASSASAQTNSGTNNGDGDLDAGSPLLDGTAQVLAAGEGGLPTRVHAVLRRSCERTPFGPDYLLFPKSTECDPNCRAGTECASSQDCTKARGGDCVGLPDDARCEYAGALGAVDDVCSADSDCKRGASPHCRAQDIRYTFCLYGTCRSHADCAPDERCECPTGGSDPVCVKLGCDQDTDCPAPQTCRLDQSYGGAANRRHCSTPQDTCTSKADCTPPNEACGFTELTNHWLCKPFAIID